MKNFTYLLPAKQGKGLMLLLVCFFVCSGLLAQEKSLQVKASAIESTCAGEGHVISLQATGGEGPYTYLWQDGVKGNFRKDLASGTYVCMVKDAKGQSVSRQFSFGPKPAALELSYSQENAADGSATLTLQVMGGKAPYSYFWFGPGINTESWKKTSSLSGLSAGTFQVIVQDANECSANRTVIIK